MAPEGLRELSALVAHVLHTPLSEVLDMPLVHLIQWGDEAVNLIKKLHPYG